MKIYIFSYIGVRINGDWCLPTVLCVVFKSLDKGVCRKWFHATGNLLQLKRSRACWSGYHWEPLWTRNWALILIGSECTFMADKVFLFCPICTDSWDFMGHGHAMVQPLAPGIGQAKLAFVISVLYLRQLSSSNVPRSKSRFDRCYRTKNWTRCH